MKFDSFNRWLSLLSSIGVLAGFALVAFQLNLNTKAIRLQTAISVNQQIVAGEIAYMGETTHTAFAVAAFDPSALSTEQVGQVWAYLNVGVNSTWNLWRAYQAGLATEADWEQSLRAVNGYLGFRFGRIYWDATKGGFPADFVREVDAQLAKSDPRMLEGVWREMLAGVKSEAPDRAPEEPSDR